jgi:hypothetical protein
VPEEMEFKIPIPEELREDVTKLGMFWNIRQDEAMNASEGDFHHPPHALSFFTHTIALGECYNNEFTPAFETREMAEAFGEWYQTMLTAYGAAMFEFGQFCYKNGVLVANMDPCDCLAVSDEDIEQLIKGEHEG